MTAYEIRQAHAKREEELNKQLKDTTYRSTARVEKGIVETFVRRNNSVAIKILFYMARKHNLDQCLVNIDERVIDFEFDVDDILKYCNIDRRSLRDNIKYMTETSIEIVDTKRKALTWITILPKAELKQKKLTITMFREIVEMISTGVKQYVTVDTDNLMRLKHKHSLKMIQLLEMINGFKFIDKNGKKMEIVKKQKYFSLEDINGFFGTKYVRAVDFERKIIKVAKHELDQYSKLSFKYEKQFSEPKSGRPKLLGFTIEVKHLKNRQSTMDLK